MLDALMRIRLLGYMLTAGAVEMCVKLWYNSKPSRRLDLGLVFKD